jgi:hypothetical protein
MKFFFLLNVCIFTVLATNGDDDRGQSNLNHFVVKKSIDTMFQATPIALKNTKGCAEYLAEWMRQRGDLYTTIESTDATNTRHKRSGLTRQKKIWSSKDRENGVVTRKEYESAANTANPFYGGLLLGADAEPNEGTAAQHEGQPPTPPIYFVSKSTVDEILRDGRCRNYKGLRNDLARILRPSTAVMQVASARKRYENESDAAKERRNEVNKQASKRFKQRETIKKFVNLPDIKDPLTTMTSDAVMTALVNMKYGRATSLAASVVARPIAATFAASR